MPPARKFTPTELQVAALHLVDHGGLASLTMRSLATALGTGAMTIYNYVDGRVGLEALLVDAVMAKVRLPHKPHADWREEVRRLAAATWHAIRLHPEVIPLIAARRSFDLDTLTRAEAMLEALARSGRSGASLLAAFRLVSGFVMGFAQAELSSPVTRALHEPTTAVIDRMRSLSADRFPRLIEIAKAASSSVSERELRAGLDIILDGLDA